MSTIGHPPHAAHLQTLETVPLIQAKASLKNLEDWRELVGRAIQRCLSLAGITQKEAAALLHRDPAQIQRWIVGSERAQMDTLFSVECLRQPLIQSLSEMAGADVEVTISLRKRA